MNNQPLSDEVVMGEYADKVFNTEPLIEVGHGPIGETSGLIPIHEPTMIIADDKPKLSNSEIRKLRRKFMTVIHPRVEACGHKYVAERQPRHRNCPHCWFAWFQNHGELVQTTDELHNTDGGIQMIMDLQGSKFLKMFRRFMSTIAHLKAQEAGA